MDFNQIPDKTYFKIGEVAKLLDLQAYVLRYWETEFDVLAPEKTRTGQRAYRRSDIELLFLIRKLLYEEQYTIAGAQRQIKLRKRGEIEPLGPEAQQDLVRRYDNLLADRDDWSRERARLAAAAESHREEAARLRVQNEALEDENAQLAAAQIEYESSIRRLRDEVTERVGEVSRLTQQLEANTLSGGAENEALAQESAAQLDALQAEFARVEAELADKATANTELSGQVLTLQAMLDAAIQAQSVAEAEQTRLRDDLEALEADFASAESELERLETQRVALRAQVEDTSAITAVQDELQTALASNSGLQQELRDVRASFEAVQAELHASNNNNEALQQQLGNAHASLEALQAELQSTNGSNAALQSQLDSAHASLELLQQQLQEVGELKTSQSTLRRELDAAQATIASLRADYTSVMQERKAASSRHVSNVHVLRRELQSLAAMVN